MFYFYNTPNGTSYGQLASCTARAANKIYLIDPKHLKQSREDGPYCTISGNGPSSMTFSKTTMVSKIDVVREFFAAAHLFSISLFSDLLSVSLSHLVNQASKFSCTFNEPNS